MTQQPRPGVKQQRAERRAAQLAEFKRREAARKRNAVIGRLLAITGIVAVVALVGTIIWLNVQPKPVVLGVQTWDDLEAGHVEGDVRYPMTPPAGGPHNPAWLDCGIYEEPQIEEFAVHSLEHGAIWITYDPATTSDADLAELRGLTPDTYAILSPYPGIGEAYAISAWGAQLRFTDPDDPDARAFIETYWRSADAPEPGAPCTGALTGPGLVR